MKGIVHRGLLAVAPVLLGMGCRAERMTEPPSGPVVSSATIGLAVSAQSFTTTGSLNVARVWHTATLLNNGMVLIAGGIDGNPSSARTELYNPATGTFTATGSLNTARVYHTATLLNNGMALVAGGTGSANDLIPLTGAELYNPATGIFTATGMPVLRSRAL